MEARDLDVDARNRRGGDHLCETGGVAGVDATQVVAQHRDARMPKRERAQVGLPGGRRRQADEQPALGGGGEQRIGLVAAKPAVVDIVDVVRDSGERVAVVERAEPVGAARDG